MPCQSRLRRRKPGRYYAQSLGYTPQQVAKAYQFVSVINPFSVKIGIVSLGGSWAGTDISAAFQKWALPVPTIANLSVDGATPVADPNGADVENALDLEWAAGIWSACTGTPAQLVFATAPNSDTGIADAITALVKAGCGVISISWGQALSQWSAAAIAATENALAYASANGVWVFVASGDNSADDGTNAPTPDYPAASVYSWACGGTSLSINAADGSISNEKAWGDGRSQDEGGGGGYAPIFPMPSWQVGIVPKQAAGAFRGIPDSSSVADPSTGGGVFVGGGWQVVGGTSWSAPTTAAYFAVCLAAGSGKAPLGPRLYPVPAAFRDITTGSDGYPAVAGWDAATGLGSINGPILKSVLTMGSVPAPQPTPVPIPPTPVPPTPVPVPPVPPAPPIPVPDGIGKAQLDAAFVALEAKNPRWKFILVSVNQALDQMLFPGQSYRPFHAHLLGGLTLAQIESWAEQTGMTVEGWLEWLASPAGQKWLQTLLSLLPKK